MNHQEAGNMQRWVSAQSDYDCCQHYHQTGQHDNALCPVIQYRGGVALCEWIGSRITSPI